MRINILLILSIVLAVSLVVVAFTLWQAGQERHRLTLELEKKSALLAESMHDGIQPLMAKGNVKKLQQLVDKYGASQRILGLAVINLHDSLVSATTGIDEYLPAVRGLGVKSMDADTSLGDFYRRGEAIFHCHSLPIKQEGALLGALLVLSDAVYIRQSIKDLWKRNFLRLLIQALAIAAVTLLVIQWSVFGPLERMVEWMKTARFEQYRPGRAKPPQGFFAPL